MPNFQRLQIMGVTGDAADFSVHDFGPISHFSVCVREGWRVPTSGELKIEETWFRCTAFGKVAEQAHKALKRGTWVLVEGRIRVRRKPGKDGIEREYWGVNVDVFRKCIPRGWQRLPREQEEDDEPAIEG